MERSEVTPNKKKKNKNKGRLARAFAKALHKHSVAGKAPDEDVHKLKLENMKSNLVKNPHLHPFLVEEEDDEKKLNKRALTYAFLANVFATISAVKAAYAELQYAQSPYDPDGIQSADDIVVSELKNLSELKKQFVEHHMCISSSLETKLVLTEIQEHKSLIKTYGVMTKKLDSEVKLKESEIKFLKEKLEEAIRENKLLEERLNVSGVVQSSFKLSSLSTSHFVTFLHQAIRSIRRFVRILKTEMESADWDLDAASNSIENGVDFLRSNHKCYAFESFVSHQMFDNFNHPESHIESFNETAVKDRKQLFFNEFVELKSVKPLDYLLQNRESKFSRYCRFKYMKLVHQKMEQSLFGNLDQRNSINAGEFPETSFFVSFVEMAKRIWVLRCLAFSLNPEVSIFKANKSSRFSRVYMESVCDDDEHFSTSSNSLTETDAQVAFTVIPGFRIGKTVIQCQVYLLTSCIDDMVQSHDHSNRVEDQ